MKSYEIEETFDEIQQNEELKDKLIEDSLKWINKRFDSMNIGVEISSDKKLNQSQSKNLAQNISDSFDTTVKIGHIYHYLYFPKTKLKYYDRFPLTLVLEKYKDGFLGINFHYLSLEYRFALMSQLWKNVYPDKENLDEETLIKVRYKTLSTLGGLNFYKPCLKRYLYSQTKSQIYHIPSSNWLNALLLPSERFFSDKKSSLSTRNIHRKSKQII